VLGIALAEAFVKLWLVDVDDHHMGHAAGRPPEVARLARAG
jgi:hypothetical protein